MAAERSLSGTAGTKPTPSALLDRLRELAEQHADRPAFTVAHPDGSESTLSFRTLRDDWLSVAATLRDAGIGPGDVLVLSLENHIRYLSLVLGAWEAGAAALLISPWLPAADLDALLELTDERLGRPVLVRSTAQDTVDSLVVAPSGELTFRPSASAPRGVPGSRATDSYLYLTSGGTTGIPKVMPYPLRWTGRSGSPYSSAGLKDRGPVDRASGARSRLLCGSLYHTGNFAPSFHVLLTGSGVVAQEDFAPDLTVRLLRRHDVYSLGITPGHMMSVLTLPDLDRGAFDRLGRVTHGAAPCPRWVKEGWIELVGPDRLFEIYYSSELGGSSRPVVASGAEWLERPGTVGKAQGVRVLDEHGRDVPPGTVGEIYFAQTYGAAHTYVGPSTLRRAPDDASHISVADLGWLDEDGYLFLADRMSDTVEIEGTTVYPRNVEKAIAELPEVGDVAVVGLWDENGAPYLHALVQGRDGTTPALDAERIREHCAASLTAAEVPARVQFTTALPRTAEGKLRKSVVRDIVETSPDGAVS
ncbi:class I adenylate-forming enzyme family protein [Streptomyces anulatus]|uniref:class I adenylate-forming enzyme family protein n=1 Tax=Streptomyces anulatus TaxID=1892 RepID=UPI001C25C40C|nr:AMP-binding protein [Streptomyces anulatus]